MAIEAARAARAAREPRPLAASSQRRIDRRMRNNAMAQLSDTAPPGANRVIGGAKGTGRTTGANPSRGDQAGAMSRATVNRGG